MNFISSLFQSPSTRLFQAIQNDDVETVKKILKPLQGNKDKIKSVFNSQDKESGHTPLQAAIQRNHCSLVKALLDGGANPNECYEMVSCT